MAADNPRWEGERSWARQQLEEAEATEGEMNLVMRMLEEWWEDDLGLSDGSCWRALGFFEELARGKALPPPEQEDIRWRWEQARPGGLVVRDYVRVKLDAYEGQTGLMHNGRSGPIVRISMGDVLVKYDDGKKPAVEGIPPRHSPHKLEKRFPA